VIRHAIAALAVLGAGLALAELAVRGAQLFPEARERFAASLRPGNSAFAPEASPSLAMLHPYQGWSLRPDAPLELAYYEYLRAALPRAPDPADHQRNVFGFRSRIRDYREVPDSDFAVGIFGGSVASNLACIAGRDLAERLAALRPELAGRVQVLNFSEGGFKQPQPLAVLAQMQLLGVPLDAVIELDGFNEVVFGGTNAKSGVHPLFPSLFHTQTLLELTRSEISGELVAALAEIARARRRAAARGERWRESPLRASALLQAALGARSLRDDRRASELEAALQSQPPARGDALLAALPDACLASREEGACAEQIAALWLRASLAMRRLALGAGAVYVHALQPSQYLEGSKRLTPRERERAYRPEAEWPRLARGGYPLLQRAGESLRRQGVAFEDLTGIFREVSDTLYVDDCCHLNRRGNRILALRLAELVAAELGGAARGAADARASAEPAGLGP